ncbi:MAG TPA: S53 family peptidase [Terracidiphilus sp.]|nr:S53 family peptidase [Terracidiphilus sp.]
MSARIRDLSSFAALLLLAGCGGNLRTTNPSNGFTTPAFTTPVDESRLVTLTDNVPPLARSGFDEGVIDPNTRLDRMLLLLQSSAVQQSALDALVEAQQNPGSPQYQQWLTPAEFGALFGVGGSDLMLVTAWLATHGFTVEEVSAGRRLIVFSGTAAQLSSAFHTELHQYLVNGVEHIANSSDPQIPAALAGVVGGVVTLSDFRRSSLIASQKSFAWDSECSVGPEYSAGSTHNIFPADFAAIYDLSPLYSAGTTGSGAAIAIAGRSNINFSDVETFRSISGLAANTPTVIVGGTNPGLVTGDQGETTLDVEWSGAVAPAAAINLVTAASTATTDGIDLASAYIVNHATAPVMSVSYGSCEQDMGAAELAFYNSLWEQAASQGMSVFVASGDAGAAGCQSGSSTSGTSAAVNGLCTSPYATCVGGTEFNEGANPAQYWSAANSAAYGSALGYIPEAVWNESALDGGTGLWASGGGASAVYAQPASQQNVSGTAAAGGMRAVPDVSLSAANHDGYFMVEDNAYWVVSGTSVAAPSFAGIMALVTAKENGKGQGSANPRLYALTGAVPTPFHATPSGNNTVPGVEGFSADGATYNLATGLGSVDGALLVNGWNTSSPSDSATLALMSVVQSATIAAGGSVTIQFTAVTGGSFAGNLSFSVSGLPSGVTAAWSANPLTPASSASTNSASLKLAAAQGAASGSTSVVVSATGDGLTAKQTIMVTVNARVNGCARFSLLPTSCRPLPRVPAL